MKSAEGRVAIALAIVQVLVLFVIVTILHTRIGAGPVVCAALLVAGAFLALGELRALNYAAIRQDRQPASRRPRFPRP